MIQLVHRADIQENKWHSLMVIYPGLNPYACLEYLDAVCKNWSAFVFNDYEAVLPICWNKKWGVKYIYQPPFLQQMNYVGAPLNQAALDRIKQIIYSNFTFIDLKINIPISETTRKNYVLSLKENYDSISQNYSSQTKKNLKEKEQIELGAIDIESFLKFYKTNTIPKIINWKKEYEITQLNLLKLLEKRGELILLCAKHEGNIVSMTALIHKPGILIHLMPSSSAEGRTVNGTSVIIDHLIQKFAGKDYIFDFEGSELDGIAHFNKGFGATNQPYYHLTSDKMSFPFNMFNK